MYRNRAVSIETQLGVLNAFGDLVEHLVAESAEGVSHIGTVLLDDFYGNQLK